MLITSHFDLNSFHRWENFRENLGYLYFILKCLSLSYNSAANFLPQKQQVMIVQVSGSGPPMWMTYFEMCSRWRREEEDMPLLGVRLHWWWETEIVLWMPWGRGRWEMSWECCLSGLYMKRHNPAALPGALPCFVCTNSKACWSSSSASECP